MALFFRTLAVAALVLGQVSVQASTSASEDSYKYYTIKRMVVEELKSDQKGNETSSVIQEKSYGKFDAFGRFNQVDPIERAGRVIGIARDLVALGEDIYRLVIKGKPTVTTRYAPISIIPRVAGENVEILDTEGWRFPVKRTFRATYENLYGATVVDFRYSVVYSYGGSYDGKGAYLTSVQIIPESITTLFGFDFTANMKLGGFQNQGTRANPIAAATLLMDYTVSSVLKSITKVDTFHVNGKGQFRKF